MSYEACYGVRKAVYFDKTHRGKPSLRFVEVDLTSKRKTKVRIGLADICPSGITLNFSFFLLFYLNYLANMPGLLMEILLKFFITVVVMGPLLQKFSLMFSLVSQITFLFKSIQKA